VPVIRKEIEQKMDALAREYHETHALTEEFRPLAVLLSPLLTETSPLAVLLSPPLTEEFRPLARLF
jgi:hypothetical protein